MFRAGFDDSGLWRAADCESDLNAFVCRQELSAAIAASVDFDGDVFELHSEQLSFINAQAVCQSRGGNLGRITTEEELNAVVLARQEGDISFFWVGVDAISSESTSLTGRFSYTDGSTEALGFIRGDVGVLPWDNFPATEPNSLDEDCGEYGTSHSLCLQFISFSWCCSGGPQMIV